MPASTRSLRLLLTNAFGLRNKLGELQHVLNTKNADVAIITETKFSPEAISVSESTIPGFHPPIRLDRTVHGGGVAVWIREHLAYEHIDSLDHQDHEILWLSVQLHRSKKLVLGALYRPGSCSGSDISLLDYLDSHLDTARRYGSHILLAGDFNIHNKDWLGSSKTTPAGEFTEDMCAVHGLVQHVNTATRGENILDLVISDSDVHAKVSHLPPLGASDHDVLLADLSVSAFREPKTTRTVWRYNKADWDRLRHFYRSHDWSSSITSCPNQSCSNVSNIILEGMARFIPSRQLTSRPTDPSWWTPECTDAVNERERAWKKARNQSSAQSLEAAQAAKNRGNLRLMQAKSAHLATLKGKLSNGNMTERSWWSAVKQAGGSSRNSSMPTLTDSGGREHVSNAEKAECFGRYFSSKCSLGINDFPATYKPEDFPSVKQRTIATLSAVRFRPATVQKELRRLNPVKATGPDDIPARVLKMCADALCDPLSKLFSLCFTRKTQPLSWKIARVVPVYKKKSRSLPQNYRPVSLLSLLSKVMEAIVNRQIMNFLEKNSVLSRRQFGFRKGLSAADLLLKLQHEWASAASRGGASRILAVDIAGAFDKVSHPGLLHKASVCGLSGPLLCWLRSYLSDCQLFVVVGGQQSSLHPIQPGVPQGSILGPTLFLLYINDCEDVLADNGTDLATYADDTTLYQLLSAYDDCNAAAARLQSSVDAVAQWGEDWKVTFEPSKSQALSVCHHQQPPSLPPIQFNGVVVPEEREVKLLGVTFDRQLTFSSHLRTVETRAKQRLRFMAKVAPLLTSHGLITVYKGFVRPTMEYSCLVWISGHCARLDRIQHRALKLIGPGTWLPTLSHRRMVSALCLLYKLCYLPVTHPLKSLLPMPANTRPTSLHPTRLSIRQSLSHPHQLSSDLPVKSRNSMRNAFPDCAIPEWNSLPADVLSVQPHPAHLQVFKIRAHRHLLSLGWLTATDAL